ncbi:MAG TPA: proline--tRNA ligase [Miltoncostaeaceae bacterium]|nr:proline--tRNA ligase [Miltoncostaeaceae bacterium]
MSESRAGQARAPEGWRLPDAPLGGSLRLSGRLWPTLRDPPADAEAVSHILMVRAGLVRQLAAGLYTLLPFGLRAIRRVEAIVREEMDRIGAQELQMPILQPAEIWEATGRYPLAEQFKLEDRAGRAMVLGMTHEEIITWHAAREVRSYRDLPQAWYQIQTKLRDEPRAKSGMLRVREFSMKDSYSLDRDEAGLDASYAAHAEAYARIMDRSGLHWYMVESDTGMMGGSGAHEFMAPSPAGEDTIVRDPGGGYAANAELAVSVAREPDFGDTPGAPEPFDTPGVGTIDELAAFTGLPPARLAKSVVLVADGGPVLALVRGEHALHEKKLARVVGHHRAAHPDEIREWFGADPGSLGPVGLPSGSPVRVVADETLAEGHYVTGANRDGVHLSGVVLGRDFRAETADIREVLPGEADATSGAALVMEPVIEVGNIFKLGTRYAEALGATYLDAEGRDRPIVMGSYGIGPGRIVAAAIEQSHDEAGIVWPRAIAPFDVHLVLIGGPDTPQAALADGLYEELSALALEVLYDDRADTKPGEKFVEAELLGCPLRVTVGARTLPDGPVEVQVRRGRERREVPLDGAAAAIRDLWEACD